MQTLILGLDAFDPSVFERLSEQGKVPHLTRYVEAGGYSRFAVTDPPQSEVSWTSIATGLNPGGHGVFDFVHRDPATYTLSVSLLPTKSNLFGTQFVPPYTARTIFDQAVRQGFPATVLWWPATFPARPESPVRTLPGLGTPDIHGRLGVGTLFSSDPDLQQAERKTRVVTLKEAGRNRYRGRLGGPAKKSRDGSQEAVVELALELAADNTGRLTIDRQSIELIEGQWSPIIEVTFKMGLFVKVRALTRAILTQVRPDTRLYFLPLQLHPLHSPWRYGTPGSFVKETWANCGPFLTVGWPQDTTGLEDQCISDEQFLRLCETIDAGRERVLMYYLPHFHEGILASVSDTLDRVQHMFWRERPDIIDEWYIKLDAMIGRVEQKVAGSGKDQTKVVIVSDHGFSDFNHKVHLNRWLIDHQYLALENENESGSLQDVDWSHSRAYGVGLNSIYLNLAGREGQGCVPLSESLEVIDTLRRELLAWRGPDGRAVVQQAWSQGEAFEGPLSAYGPDLVVGFAPGYRASAQTGLGQWEPVTIEPNHDHWGADHCLNAHVVPGVLFANRDLTNYPHPSYRDFPALTIEAVPDTSHSAPPPSSYGKEDQEIIEERLKSLGYL